MSLLKQAASKLKLKKFQRSSLFYDAFLDSVRKHGRVREMEFMTHYFVSLKNPMIPFGYAGLGIKLLAKGKIRPDFGSAGKGNLNGMFKKVAELEK